MGGEGAGQTMIAQGVKVEGDFSSKGNVVIEGEVNGSVSTDSDLTVGESAKIQANVRAGNATVAGEIQGNLQVDDKLDVASSARIRGDVTAAVLVVAAGATINGKVSMGSVPSEEKAEPAE